MRRGRLAVAAAATALLPLVASLAVAPARAKADTACADVWLVRQDGSRQYIAGPGNCVETGMGRTLNLGAQPTLEGEPYPWWKGVGFDIWITTP